MDEKNQDPQPNPTPENEGVAPVEPLDTKAVADEVRARAMGALNALQEELPHIPGDKHLGALRGELTMCVSRLERSQRGG